jgi:hypothetical protein
MPALHRIAILALLVATFVALATVTLDKPGYYDDEVVFVPVSLRTLGQCDVDAAVTRQWGCFPLMQAPGSVGAVKAWLHAPIFALFGINTWTVRLPSILVAAVALVVVWTFARRELGGAWAILLLALLATDPVLSSHARLDWGPQMIAALMRVTALAGLWRWLQTGRIFWLALTCAAVAVGFADKLDFIWVIGALLGAAVLVAGPLFYDRLRDGTPWQPALAGVTGGLLLWGTLTLARQAANLDASVNAGMPGIGERLANLWQLYAATFSGTSVLNRVFGTKAVTTAFFNVLALVQLLTAAALLSSWRPWTPARRFLAYLTMTLVLLIAAIAVTPWAGGPDRPFMIWPLPTLHLVTLLAIVAQHAGGTADGRGTALRRSVAVVGTVVCGALLAWNAGWQLRYIDAWRDNHDYQAPFDSAIAKLGARIDELEIDRVIAVDRGLHQQLVTLAGRRRAADFREWTWRLTETPDLERDDLRRAVAEQLSGRRVAFVLHGPPFTVLAGARERLEALLRRHRPCARTEESIVNAAAKPLYAIVVADYRNCAAGPAG